MCARLPGPGELCNRECRDIGDVCATLSHRCEPSAEGSVCADSYGCGMGQRCDASSRCRLTVRRIGESCSYPDGPYCAAGTFCARFSEFGAETCQPLAAVGTTCADNRGCASGWCDAGLCRDGGCEI